MGKGDSGTPTKAAKSSSAQDPPPAPASYVEWAAAFQAYYNGATPAAGYFPPALAPGQPHPYMWAGQPLLPPYGGAPPFAAMYPPGYPYAHPSMPQGPHPYPTMTPPGRAREATTATATTDQGDYKSSDGKECSSMKQSKGSASNFGRLQSRGQDDSKNTPTSTNALQSQSAESCSDACSDDSEEDNRQDMLEKKSRKLPPEVGTPTNQIVAASSTLMERPIGVAPTTTLDVGFDYWNDATSGAATVGKGKKNPAVTQALLPTFPINPLFGIAGREGATSDFWLQDDRELKRQRRKQSNRESARRSRLRKQAECEDLGTKVDTLTAENMALRSEINRLVEERNKLSTENSTLLEQLRKDRDEGSSTAKMLKGNLQTLCSIQDNGKIRDTPADADAQILRHIREEKQGQPAEQV